MSKSVHTDPSLACDLDPLILGGVRNRSSTSLNKLPDVAIFKILLKLLYFIEVLHAEYENFTIYDYFDLEK